MRSASLLIASLALLCAACSAPQTLPPPTCPEVAPMPDWAVQDLCRLTGITDPPCERP